MELKEIRIEEIKHNPENPREDWDEIQELAENILSNELLNPIIVCEDKGKYLLIDGERRLRACKLAKLKTIISYIKKYDNELQKLKEIYLLNLMRKNFKPLENAKIIKQIWIASGKPSSRSLSDQLGTKHQTILEAFTLLEAPEEVKQAVKEKKLGQRSVTYLSKLPKEKQIKIVKKIREGKRIGQIPIAEEVEKEILTEELNKKISSKKEFNKGLIQIKNWILSFRNSISDCKSSIEKTLKILLISTKFIPIMDEKQKKDLDTQLDRFVELLEKGNQTAKKIQEKLE